MRTIGESIEWLLLGALALLAALLIAAHPQPIHYDQNFVRYVFSPREYPFIDNGISSTLIVGLYNMIVSPAPEALNSHIRILAMLFFAGGATLLFSQVLRRRWLTALAVVFLFASRYPFLWLSTELFAGAFLALAVCAVHGRWKVWRRALFLVLFALSKPDTFVVAAALLAYDFWLTRGPARSRRDWQQLLAWTAGFTALFVLPAYLFSQSAAGGVGRHMLAIRQHYADLVSRHQLVQPAPDPWNFPNKYFDATFPGVSSYLDVLWRYPSRYFDFLALSVAQGLKNLVRLLQILVLVFPLRWYLARQKIVPVQKIEKLCAVTLIGIVPFVLVSFPHIRYLARYYPLFLVSLFAVVERVFEMPAASRKNASVRLGAAVLLTGLVCQLYLFAGEFASEESLRRLWTPD